MSEINDDIVETFEEESILMQCESDAELEDSDFFSNVVSMGNKPYMFEPKCDQTENNHSYVESETETDVVVTRVEKPVDEWCQCGGRCKNMGRINENICCNEIAKVSIKSKDGDVSCITLHHGFSSICLNKEVLKTAMYGYCDHHDMPLDEKDFPRYIAYRQFVRWVYKRLGKYIRVPLPACVVSAIRNQFPNIDGSEYHGFNFPSIN